MSGRRLPLLKTGEQLRDEARIRREILQKILADPRFEGFRLGNFWPAAEEGPDEAPARSLVGDEALQPGHCVSERRSVGGAEK